MSILESPRYKLCITHGHTLVPPSLRGWEVFPTPRALNHTRITWALSPKAPQVMSVTLGSPLCPWCFGHSSWRSARQYKYKCCIFLKGPPYIHITPVARMQSDSSFMLASIKVGVSIYRCIYSTMSFNLCIQ